MANGRFVLNNFSAFNALKKQDEIVDEEIIFGVKRAIADSTTTWIRTDDAIGMVANATHDGSTVQNDFDTAPIYKYIITVDIGADGTIYSKYGDSGFSFTNPRGFIMTYFPGFWWKRWQSEGYEYIQISNVEQTGFNYSEAFYMGRYTATGTSSEITCKSGLENFSSLNMTDFRTEVNSIGNRWGIMDIWKWSILQLLYLVEYADYNSQIILGYGNSNSSAPINTGECDSLEMKSGCLINDWKHAVIYRGIENIFGNAFQKIDGINIATNYAWICKDKSQYAVGVSSSPYVQLGYVETSSSGFIKKMGIDNNYPEIQRAIEAGGTNNTYIPDEFTSWSKVARIVVVGGNYATNFSNGLWQSSCMTNTSKGSNAAYRLIFIP